MHLFLHVLYSIKACKISIYVVQFVVRVRNMSCFSVRWMDLVWDSSSVVQSFNHGCMCKKKLIKQGTYFCSNFFKTASLFANIS